MLLKQSFSINCARPDISFDVITTELGEKVNDGLESSIPGEEEKEIAEIFRCGSETAFYQCRERNHFGMISMRKLEHTCTLHDALSCSATMTPPFHRTFKKTNNSNNQSANSTTKDINSKKTHKTVTYARIFRVLSFRTLKSNISISILQK